MGPESTPPVSTTTTETTTTTTTTTTAPKTAARMTREMYDLKQKAAEYYRENGVPKKMEEVLNSMFFENPKDVYGHLAEFFENLAFPPVISRIAAREIMDSKGQPCLEADLYCTIKNHEEYVTTSAVSFGDIPDYGMVEERDEMEKRRAKSISASVAILETHLNPSLQGKDPASQRSHDETIVEILNRIDADYESSKTERANSAVSSVHSSDTLSKNGGDTARSSAVGGAGKRSAERAGRRPSNTGGAATTTTTTTTTGGVGAGKEAKGSGKKKKSSATNYEQEEALEHIMPGAEIAASVSTVLCRAGAKIKGVPLFRHIRDLWPTTTTTTTEDRDSFVMPIPLVPIIQSGKSAVGKLNFVKEFLLAPKPGIPLSQSIKQIVAIYHFVCKALNLKFGNRAVRANPQQGNMRNVNDFGSFCPQYDRPEQGLDLLTEAISSVGLTPGEDVAIFLNCAAHETYDWDKSRYEPYYGQLVTSDQMLDQYAEIFQLYPSVIGLIDPLRRQDKEAWNRLCERFGSHCFVFTQHPMRRPNTILKEGLKMTVPTGAAFTVFDRNCTVSEFVDCTNRIRETGMKVILAGGYSDTTDDFIADLAVGAGVDFVRIGAPARGERVAKLNRLLQIESDLRLSIDGSKIGEQKTHAFRIVRPASPPPTDVPATSLDAPDLASATPSEAPDDEGGKGGKGGSKTGSGKAAPGKKKGK